MVRDIGFRVWGLGFGVLDFGFWVRGLGFEVWGLGFGVKSSGFIIKGFELRVYGLGLILGLGFRGQGYGFIV